MMMQIYRQISEWACHDEAIRHYIEASKVNTVHHDPS